MEQEVNSNNSSNNVQSTPEQETQSRGSSLFIGILLIVAAFLAYNYFNTPSSTNNSSTTSTPTPSQNTAVVSGTPAPTSTQAEANASVTPAPSAAGEYVVQEGDTLWKIAEKELNDGFLWKEIARLNNISEAGTLTVGTKLALPAVVASSTTATPQPSVAPTTPAPTEVAATITPTSAPTTTPGEPAIGTPSTNGGSAVTSEQSYTVQKGDTLWGIAQKMYGNGAQWKLIFENQNNHLSYYTAHNGQTYPLVHAGNVLVIPALSAATGS